VYTISIETGLQNVTIAFLLIALNFPSPQSDYALLPLIAVTALTGLPLWLIFLVKTVVETFKNIRKKKTKNRRLDEEKAEIKNLVNDSNVQSLSVSS
jgi:hypothetical protein